MCRTSCRGFTIVEALVAIALVTTGVLALAALAFQVTGQVASSRERLVGLWLADAALAFHLRPPLADTSAECLRRDVAGCHDTVDGHGVPTSVAPAYVRRWRVTTLVPPPGGVWSVSACLVPARARGDAARVVAGACVTRLVHGGTP